MENTRIAWANHTWSPWIGCTKVHTGCVNCYAEVLSGRFGVTWGENGTRRKTSEAYWRKPLAWDRMAAKNGIRLRVFPSLCDPFEAFEEFVGHIYQPSLIELATNTDGSLASLDDLRRDFDRLKDRTPNIDWILATKRPENILGYWGLVPPSIAYENLANSRRPMYRQNVWLVYSASDQETLEAGLPDLLGCRDLVPVLGVSLEPLVGPIDLDACWPGGLPCPGRGPYVTGLDWLIVGGENPCHVEWIESIVEQCRVAGVPCFVKQLGSKPVGITVKSNKGDDPAEWPEHLRVQQFPGGER